MADKVGDSNEKNRKGGKTGFIRKDGLRREIGIVCDVNYFDF